MNVITETQTIIEPKIELYNMDCMEYMKGLEDNAFDLAIVDPPYGIGINSSGRLGHYGGKGKKWDDETPDKEYFKELFRVSKNQIIWGGNYFELPPTRCFFIWDKQQPENVSFASCEFAWTSFDKSAKTFYKRPQNADDYRIHPTQKPKQLYEWLILNNAVNETRILDTHLGSGSSAIASYKCKFDFVGLEIDKEYFDNAVKRFNNYKSQLTMF